MPAKRLSNIHFEHLSTHSMIRFWKMWGGGCEERKRGEKKPFAGFTKWRGTGTHFSSLVTDLKALTWLLFFRFSFVCFFSYCKCWKKNIILLNKWHLTSVCILFDCMQSSSRLRKWPTCMQYSPELSWSQLFMFKKKKFWKNEVSALLTLSRLISKLCFDM